MYEVGLRSAAVAIADAARVISGTESRLSSTVGVILRDQQMKVMVYLTVSPGRKLQPLRHARRRARPISPGPTFVLEVISVPLTSTFAMIPLRTAMTVAVRNTLR